MPRPNRLGYYKLFPFAIPAKLLKQLSHRCAELGVSRAQYIRQAIQTALEGKNRDPEAELLRERIAELEDKLAKANKQILELKQARNTDKLAQQATAKYWLENNEDYRAAVQHFARAIGIGDLTLAAMVYSKLPPKQRRYWVSLAQRPQYRV